MVARKPRNSHLSFSSAGQGMDYPIHFSLVNAAIPLIQYWLQLLIARPACFDELARILASERKSPRTTGMGVRSTKLSPPT